MNVGPSARDAERLSFLTKSPLERLIPHGQPRFFSKGVRIAGGEQLCEAAFLSLSGGCELRRSLPNGQEIVLENLGRGAAFGGLEKIDAEEVWTAVVATADTVVLGFDRENLEKLRAELPSGSPSIAFESGKTVTAFPQPSPPAEEREKQRELGATSSAIGRKQRLQVVTLAFVSEQLPVRTISEELACSVCAETDSKVVLVRFIPQNCIQTANARPEFFLNGEFH